MKKVNKYKIIRKTLSMLTACSIVLAVNSNSIFAESDFNSYDSQINTENMIIAKKSFDDMSESNQEKIINASEVCLKNGKKAADIVNSFKNQTNFRIALRKMLDNYFVKDSKNSKELIEFENAIDSSADEIIENYKQAEEERNNSDNLSYETEKVMLSFPYGTSKLDIDTIIKNEAVSCEIIDDGNVVIPDELPEYKKKRLEKIKDYKTDIVILADIRIEDTVSRAISKFQKYDCIKSAEHNIYFESDGTITTSSGSATTNDPDFNETKQWNMKNIDIPRAWKRYETVTGMWQIWVAVIDSGVQMNHPDLRGILLRNYSVDVTRDNKKLIDCDDSKQWENGKGQYTSNHGTMVSGVIMAEGNNSTLGAGVASIANEFNDFSSSLSNSHRLMAIKCDETYGSDRHITKAFLSKAINYAVTNGAEIINISYSATKSDYNIEDIYKKNCFDNLEATIKKAIAAEVTVVCSAGNDSSTTLRYPAAFDGVIGVGATQPNNTMATYSNQSNAVDIVAPGGEEGVKKIFSTSPTTINPNGYSYGEGTSYATPHVAGTLAMMKSINYYLTPAQLLTRLQARSTITVPGTIDKTKTFKLLNAGKSVELMDNQ